MPTSRPKTSVRDRESDVIGRRRLAAILQDRIRSGEFKPGDKFPSVRQIADDYQVSPATAHHGMKLLADGRWLETRARSGAVVGPAASQISEPGKLVDTIQVVAGKRPMADLGPLGPGVFEGLVASWPEASVQLNLLPDDDPGFVDQLLVATSQRTRIVGAIITRCPRAIKQRFLNCDFPVVVIGHVDDDLDMPFVDRDQFTVGRTLAAHLFDRGHQRLGLMMYMNWMPGDNPFLSGVQSVMAERNVAADRLRVHSVTPEVNSVHVAFDALRNSPGGVTGMICRSDRMAVECLRAAQDRRLRVPDDLAIVSAGHDTIALTKVRPRITAMSHDGEEIGRLAGALLVKLGYGHPVQRTHVEVPSELVHRESS